MMTGLLYLILETVAITLALRFSLTSKPILRRPVIGILSITGFLYFPALSTAHPMTGILSQVLIALAVATVVLFVLFSRRREHLRSPGMLSAPMVTLLSLLIASYIISRATALFGSHSNNPGFFDSTVLGAYYSIPIFGVAMTIASSIGLVHDRKYIPRSQIRTYILYFSAAVTSAFVIYILWWYISGQEFIYL